MFPLNRRELMTGLGATVLAPTVPAVGWQAHVLQAKADVLALRPGEPDTPVWSLHGPDLRLMRGDRQAIAFQNDLPIPVVLNWRGIDGASTAEPLLARAPLASGANDTFEVPLRHAGTFFCDLALLSDGAAQPTRGLPLIIGEGEAIGGVDRDEVFLFEDWRLRLDGTAITPGIDPKDKRPLYTVNGKTTLDIPVHTNERLRLRFINGFQRNVIALKIEKYDVRIMALDGQPAEPFLARGGAAVLAPGSRVDAFIDATAPSGSTSSILLHDGTEAHPIARLLTSNAPPIRSEPLPPAPPLPSNGLPAQLELKNALRFDLPLGGPQADWVTPASFASSAAPAFRAKTGRTVVLTLTNRADTTTVFHLHGHHFRLLDRLDDGWKPFWLDTLAIEAGQTQRIAFSAEYAGRWLLESTATAWAAPRLVRWYSVE